MLEHELSLWVPLFSKLPKNHNTLDLLYANFENLDFCHITLEAIKEPIETIRFHDASKIVMDSIQRLGMSQGEIAELQEQSKAHYREVMNSLR